MYILFKERQINTKEKEKEGNNEGRSYVNMVVSVFLLLLLLLLLFLLFLLLLLLLLSEVDKGDLRNVLHGPSILLASVVVC